MQPVARFFLFCQAQSVGFRAFARTLLIGTAEPHPVHDFFRYRYRYRKDPFAGYGDGFFVSITIAIAKQGTPLGFRTFCGAISIR